MFAFGGHRQRSVGQLVALRRLRLDVKHLRAGPLLAVDDGTHVPAEVRLVGHAQHAHVTRTHRRREVEDVLGGRHGDAHPGEGETQRGRALHLATQVLQRRHTE